MSNVTGPFSFLPILGDFNRRLKIFDDDFYPHKNDFSWQPKIDVIDEEKQIVVKVDIPGVEPNNVDIQFDNHTLTIRGERDTKCQKEDKKDNCIYYERIKGSFYRSIALPGAIDEEKISAKSNHGVLTIILPKLKQSMAKKIEIKAE